MTQRKTGKHPALAAPYGSPSGRLSRSEPEFQEPSEFKLKRQSAMIQAFAMAYGGSPQDFPQQDIYAALLEQKK